ncbi:hypothetical protein [Rubripirellula reticaptiva]|uniref:Uncharacterized protein n=1 Tax=Rubripirellula reticaptiva TaxID=2528013 RepID=A0A5C6EFR4_9BACT|nr:hypothetical protein [Rubripirellula reticaptiva]TWU47802.1 hypothetical protein Poly59_46440 [Rubripirellula reticaptiva]
MNRNQTQAAVLIVADTPLVKKHFSIRSLLLLIAFAALVFVSLNQHQQNRELKRRMETLRLQIKHLNAWNEQTSERLEEVVEFVRTEPVLKLPVTSD